MRHPHGPLGLVLAGVSVLVVAAGSFVVISTLAQPGASSAFVSMPTRIALSTATETFGAPTPTTLAMTKTPLSTPSLAATAWPRPTFTPAPPTLTAVVSTTPTRRGPVPITADWQTGVNAPFGYSIRYPLNWFARAALPPTATGLGSYSVSLTSFPQVLTATMSSPMLPAEIPAGQAAVDISVVHGPLTGFHPLGERFCLDSVCGWRQDRWSSWPCANPCQPLLLGVNRLITVQLVKNDSLYQLQATIKDPPDTAERNASIAESIILSFQFIR